MKCHQRLIRESTPPEPDEDIKRALAKDFTHASVREIDYTTAKPLILKHEYLGTMGSPRWMIGLYFGECLAGVESFGTSAGTRVNEAVAGIENAKYVCELIRGCCLPWTPKDCPSWFISRACRFMADKYDKHLFVAYADERAAEVGQIYSALGWTYTGYTQASQQFVLNGKTRDCRQIQNLARDGRAKTGEQQRYRRSRAEQWALLESQGAYLVPGVAKHRFVGVYGSDTERKRLREAMKLPSLPYPKRCDVEA